MSGSVTKFRGCRKVLDTKDQRARAQFHEGGVAGCRQSSWAIKADEYNHATG